MWGWPLPLPLRLPLRLLPLRLLPLMPGKLAAVEVGIRRTGMRCLRGPAPPPMLLAIKTSPSSACAPLQAEPVWEALPLALPRAAPVEPPPPPPPQKMSLSMEVALELGL